MGGEFVDANIVVYAHDSTAGEKQRVARDLLLRLAEEGTGLTSTQILAEFFVIATRKIPRPVRSETAVESIRDLGTWQVFAPLVDDLVAAARIAERHRIHFWDALVVRAAAELGADVLWSEDLGDGQVYEGVPVRNPFAA